MDVFAAIAREVGQVLGMPLVQMSRYEPDGTATVIGVWSERPHPFQAGTRWPLEGPTISMIVRETGRPARLDDLAGVPGALAEAVRGTGIRSVAGAPSLSAVGVWGVMATGSGEGHPLPPGIEHRLAEFTELVGSAIVERPGARRSAATGGGAGGPATGRDGRRRRGRTGGRLRAGRPGDRTGDRPRNRDGGATTRIAS